jgi:hypothetical protein
LTKQKRGKKIEINKKKGGKNKWHGKSGWLLFLCCCFIPFFCCRDVGMMMAEGEGEE